MSKRRPVWRIWYEGGSSFSDLDGDPWDSPGWGVLVIMNRDPDSGRRAQSMSDFYLWRWDLGRWVGADFVGLLDYLAHYKGPCCVRMGRTVPNTEFQRVLELAEADPEFPIRSARQGDESAGK